MQRNSVCTITSSSSSLLTAYHTVPITLYIYIDKLYRLVSEFRIHTNTVYILGKRSGGGGCNPLQCSLLVDDWANPSPMYEDAITSVGCSWECSVVLSLSLSLSLSLILSLCWFCRCCATATTATAAGESLGLNVRAWAWMPSYWQSQMRSSKYDEDIIRCAKPAFVCRSVIARS